MADFIEITRPDDWHVHLRDGAMLAAVLPATTASFARAIVMPNLDPPVTTAAAAAAYRERIRACVPPGDVFEPLMTCYLTDATDPADLERGHAAGVFTAAKLYPAGATFQSERGVTRIDELSAVFEAMQRIGLPLCVHGEVTHPAVDVFDREARFIEDVLEPLRRDFPELRIVFEHVTTADAVDYVRAQSDGVAATITPHHLLLNRNALFEGGLRPHHYCLPVVKRERHRRALCAAATSGDRRFFLGTDSAPHGRAAKLAACGCAGIFNAPTALACYAEVFAAADALEALEGFAAQHGPAFYGLAPNTDTIRLRRLAQTVPVPAPLAADETAVEVFHPPGGLHWIRE